MTNTECAAIEINYVHHHHHHHHHHNNNNINNNNNNNNNNLKTIIIFLFQAFIDLKITYGSETQKWKKKTSGLDSRLACACFVADSLGPAFDS